ncbi:hypothetical protein [Spirochaeta dissipatitropha]
MKIRALSIALGIVFFAACSVDSLLVIDPLYTGKFTDVSVSRSRVAVLDGDYPWQDELYLLLRNNRIDQVILSPLLYTAGRTSAVDYPEKNFFILGLSAGQHAAGSLPENMAMIPFSRMQALEDLHDALMPLADNSALNLKITFLVLTNTSERADEAAYIQDRFGSHNGVSIMEYAGLPARNLVQQKIESLAADQPHLLVSLLGSRNKESLDFAVRHNVPLITENLGTDTSMFPVVAGSLENDLYAAAEMLFSELQSDNLPSSVHAVLYLNNNRLSDLRNSGGAADTQKR